MNDRPRYSLDRLTWQINQVIIKMNMVCREYHDVNSFGNTFPLTMPIEDWSWRTPKSLECWECDHLLVTYRDPVFAARELELKNELYRIIEEAPIEVCLTHPVPHIRGYRTWKEKLKRMQNDQADRASSSL